MKYTKGLLGVKFRPIQRSKILSYKIIPKQAILNLSGFKNANSTNLIVGRVFGSWSDVYKWKLNDRILYKKSKSLKGKDIYSNPNTWKKE